MGKKILVIDDEAVMRDLFDRAFAGTEYEIITTVSAEEALAVLQTQNIQVMFVDLKLSGMNGVDFCKQIRPDHPDAIIYAITGHTSIFEHAACLEAGFDDYYKKPLDVNFLYKAATDAFGKLAAKGQ